MKRNFYSSIIIRWLLLVWATTSVQAYFDQPSLLTTLPYRGGMVYVQRNNSLVLFGGENATMSYTNDLYELTQTATGFTWTVLPQTDPPTAALSGQAIYADGNDAMFLFGGMAPATVNQILPLQMYLYNFSTYAWRAWEGNTNTSTSVPVPENRQLFSATVNKQNGTVYIYGGALNMTRVYNDLWALDLSTFAFTQLPSSDQFRYGHTASLLSNGQLVIIGGVVVTNNNGQLSADLAPMDTLDIFDTQSSRWLLQNTTSTTGRSPSTRTSHNAVLTSDEKIIIFGGDNGANIRDRKYLKDIAILDTNTWTWTIPTENGIPPSRRSYAAAGLLDGKHFTVGFGEALNMYYNDINVWSLDEAKWIQTFDDTAESNESGLTAAVIAGITIAAVVLLLIILFLLWRFQRYIRWLIVRIHNDIWQPRTGEPLWAETARMCCRIFLMFIFALCLAFIIRQAVTSPNVTERIINPVAQVEVPDIRFCFDGFPVYQDPVMVAALNPGIACQTDNGVSCNGYIQALNMSLFTPTYTDMLGPVNCYLFRAPDFRLTSTSGANNGSRMLFTFFGNPNITYGRIHISTYPKSMDPNVVVYNLSDSTSIIMSPIDIANWLNAERNDIQATNVYTIQPFTYSAMDYAIVDHRYLQDVGWNYVGFAPITNSTPEMEISFRQESPNPNYSATHSDIGVFALTPTQYAQFIDREVKMYTLLNALGFVGGVFGLLVAFQTWLFGYRPRSPWGVVHRWSVGNMKRSLLRNLSKHFRTTSDAGIPFIHPVHRRFSMQNLANLANESDVDRIARVEERMQVLEMLFKAYYVDDEVFRSLDYANKRDLSKPNKDHRRSWLSLRLNKRRSQDIGEKRQGDRLPRRGSTSSDEAISPQQPLNESTDLLSNHQKY